MRRPFAETLVDLAASLAPRDDSGVRLTGAYLCVPLEVQVVWGHDGLEFLADLPRWRWNTFFDTRPGRLTVKLGDSA